MTASRIRRSDAQSIALSHPTDPPTALPTAHGSTELAEVLSG